jgi:hypothetical protein
MTTFKTALCGAAAALLITGAAFAGNFVPNVPVYSTSNRLKTVFSLGIQWDFSDMKPQLVGAVRRTETTSRDAVHGGKVDLAIPLSANMSFDPTLRVLGLAGGREVQGEAGFGWRVRGGEFMASVGVQAPYTNGGVNFVFNGPIKPYFGVNTIGRAPAPNTTVIFLPPT